MLRGDGEGDCEPVVRAVVEPCPCEYGLKDAVEDRRGVGIKGEELSLL